jgi:hypothetical protein
LPAIELGIELALARRRRRAAASPTGATECSLLDVVEEPEHAFLEQRRGVLVVVGRLLSRRERLLVIEIRSVDRVSRCTKLVREGKESGGLSLRVVIEQDLSHVEARL